MKNKVLIYGTGELFSELKKLISWDNIIMLGFVESVPHKTNKDGYKIYCADEISDIEFDYVLIATQEYEVEIRKKLKEVGVENTKIISGSLNADNVLENEFLFDRTNYMIWQNSKILNNVRFANERNLFWDLARGIDWIDSKLALSAGGMAVGWDYLYVMCRSLDIVKPENILEIGLGQSSKLFLNYHHHHSCKYDIIEQSKEWYEFFQTENNVPPEVNVHIRPLLKKWDETYSEELHCFSEVESIVKDKKFSFISIDGPFGCDGCSRSDLLPYIPECLADNFVIMLDDYERAGEKEMIRLLEINLRKADVQFLKKVYGTKKQFCLITSANNPFLCSLYDSID